MGDEYINVPHDEIIDKIAERLAKESLTEEEINEERIQAIAENGYPDTRLNTEMTAVEAKADKIKKEIIRNN